MTSKDDQENTMFRHLGQALGEKPTRKALRVSIFLSLASDGREAPRMTPEAIEWGNEIVKHNTRRLIALCAAKHGRHETTRPSSRQMRAWLPEQAKKNGRGYVTMRET
jgi:hypothetical protein